MSCDTQKEQEKICYAETKASLSCIVHEEVDIYVCVLLTLECRFGRSYSIFKMMKNEAYDNSIRCVVFTTFKWIYSSVSL